MQLVVTYAIFQDKRFNGRVYATRSTDSGATFATPGPITSDSTSQRFQTVGIDPDGRVFAAWLDKRNVATAIAAGKPYPGAALAYAWADDERHALRRHPARASTIPASAAASASLSPAPAARR